MKNNKISLIGMPSAGKSTVGKYLAETLGYDFIDLDSMVELKEGSDLISILEEKGGKYFLDIEYGFLKELSNENKTIISTAGSIIYHSDAMNWLKENTIICFIDTELSLIEKRLSEKPKAVVGLKEKGLQKLWDERIPVYREWADISVVTKDKDISEIVSEVLTKIQ